MLAFDIETTGLDAEKHSITVVALYGDVPGPGGPRRVDTVLNFARDGAEPNRATLLALMNEATVLCAFNGLRFDIPFIVKRLDVPPEEASEWVRKLYDPFEESKLLTDRTLSLNKLLSRYGLKSKTGTGLEAVHMAQRGDWEKLELYCRQDSVLTHEVANLILAEASAQAGATR